MDQKLEQELESLANYYFAVDALRRSAKMGAARIATDLAEMRCNEAGEPLSPRQKMIVRGAIINALQQVLDG